ncbi:MAG TPA: hypothetical protein VFW59_00395 [Gallionella sp.]|nr:hypothetical protein [Gallionella sp.]
MSTPIVLEIILWRSLAFFLLVGAAVGIFVALLLIFRSELLGRINRVANRWVSTRHLDQALERSVSVEHWCYRHHQLLGALVCLGAVYIFAYFGLRFDKAFVMAHLAGLLPGVLLDVLLDALVLTALTGAVASLYVGLLLWLRPSLLRGTEEVANQWLSTRRAVRPLEIPRNQMDEFVARHAQRVGWWLLLGSLVLLVMVLRALV